MGLINSSPGVGLMFNSEGGALASVLITIKCIINTYLAPFLKTGSPKARDVYIFGYVDGVKSSSAPPLNVCWPGKTICH